MSEKRKDSKGRLLRNGESQRADGKYMYRYIDGLGNRKTVYSWKLVDTDSVPNGKKCSESLRSMEKTIAIDLNDDIDSQKAKEISLNDMFKRFYDLRGDLKVTTRYNYSNLYGRHVENSIGRLKISKIKHSDLQSFYARLLNDKNLSPSTVTTIHCIILQCLEIAVNDHIIRINPARNALKVVKRSSKKEPKVIKALTEEQQAAFISYVWNSKTYSRLGPLFTLLLGTGLRISEALGLRWCDCDFDAKMISVTHTIAYKADENGKYCYQVGTTKTKSGMREVPMLDDVKLVLIKERESRDLKRETFAVGEYTGFIFLNNNGKVFSKGFIFDVLKQIVSDYNREEYFKAKEEKRDPVILPYFGPHVLRHTFCTRICENESDLKIIQDVMGHKRISTTMEVYNDATAARKLNSFKNLDGRFKVC